MAEVLENKGNTNNQDIKSFLRLLWENKKVFGICVVACVVGAYAYAFVKFKPMYNGVGVIDTGYILKSKDLDCWSIGVIFWCRAKCAYHLTSKSLYSDKTRGSINS